MAFQPPILFRFVGVQVVQYHVDLPIRVRRHDLVHEVQELSAPPPIIVTCNDLPGNDVKRCKQRGRAVPFVAMAEPIQCLAVGESQPALGPPEAVHPAASALVFRRSDRSVMVGRSAPRPAGHPGAVGKIAAAILILGPGGSSVREQSPDVFSLVGQENHFGALDHPMFPGAGSCPLSKRPFFHRGDIERTKRRGQPPRVWLRISTPSLAAAE